MTHEWLANSENQELLYTMCEEAVTQLAPDEVPLFEELFPDYVDAAQQGPVAVGASARGPFTLTGGEDLVAIVVIPIMIDIVASLLSASGSTAIRAIRSRLGKQDVPAEEQIVVSASRLREIVKQQMVSGKALPAGQDEVVEIFTQAVLSSLVSLAESSAAPSTREQADNQSASATTGQGE